MKLALSALFTLVLSARVCISTPVAQADPTPDAAAPGWQFKVVGNSGVLALESIVVSPTLVIFFDRSSNDTLQINGHSAWGALWDLQTNTPRALNLVTDTFCASGALLSNGTMVSVGGMHVETPEDGDLDGRMSIRLFEPCADAAGIGCTIIENPETLHLAKQRWYPSSVRIPDGSLMIIGGIDDETPFYNNVTDSVNSFEFFPSKDGGVPRPSPFLQRSLPANLFPRAFVLPDGKVFMVANNQSIIYDIQTKTETRLPDIPNGVRVTNPFDGTGALLPLSPPDYTPEVLICGGTNISDATPPLQISSQTPASNQCSRIKLTPEGIAKGWEVEHMLEGRMMPEMILMPNGQVLITNGAQTGAAAIGSVGDPVDGSSNADHPALTPSLYTPNAPLGQRISNKGLPTATIPRMYHSSVTLTGQGNILLAGSNPNNVITNQGKFPSELRVELLNPPFMFVPRPQIVSVPKRLGFGRSISVPVNIPSNLAGSNNIQVALIDLGFSSHAWHSSARLVFLEAQLSSNKRTLTVTAPPNPNIFPPGPGWLFLTINDVTSPGQMIMVGSGASPPQTAAEAML